MTLNEEIEGGMKETLDRKTEDALLDLLVGVKTVETHIGEFEREKVGGDKNLLVVGHEIVDDSNGKIMSKDLSIIFLSRRTFLDIDGISPIKLVDNALSRIQDISSEDREKVNKIARGIHLGNTQIVPFKNEEFLVKIDRENSRICTIRKTVWKVNKDTGVVECSLVLVDKEGKAYHKPIEEYNKSFWMYKSKEPNKSKLIEMRTDGLIKPIELIYNGHSLIVDNRNVYYTYGRMVYIIGEWKKDKIVINDKNKNIEDEKDYKYLKKNMGEIAIHKRYIIPYRLSETRKVEIK